jgi:hypothetical protein
MAMNLQSLDEETRKYMAQEIELDMQQDRLYRSPRLSSQGANEYPELLRIASGSGNDSSFAEALGMPGRLNATETRNTKTGVISAKVPVTAPQTLAEGEFNRFYSRGLCLRAIAAGIPSVQVYRAKQVENARSASEALIGQMLEAESLLEDLRNNIGTDTAFGLPPGPNSGLSIRLP